MDYEILRTYPHDWELFRTIRLRALATSPEAFSSTVARESSFTDQQWQDRSSDPQTAQFLAIAKTAEDSPAGIGLGIAVGRPYEQEHEPTAGGLFGMWVAPEARKCGIGFALVQAVLEWSRTAGYDRVYLDVGDENHAAIALYESCGFQPTGVTGSLPPPREHVKEHQRVCIFAS